MLESRWMRSVDRPAVEWSVAVRIDSWDIIFPGEILVAEELVPFEV
jgi:hypothetical protein